MIRTKPPTDAYRDNFDRVFRQAEEPAKPTDAEIRKLRGRIEWRHPQDSADTSPIVGTCYADTGLTDDEWYVVWSGDGRNFLGGGSWTTDLKCFTPLDDNARKILEWVSPRRNLRCQPSSPWSPA